MKKLKLIITIAVLVLTITSCKKSLLGIGNTPPVEDEKPIVTEVGMPVDVAATKNIGSSGGSLTSSDGKIELQIPAGALSSNTNISIQAISNNAPNGVGNAYRFTPDGMKFSIPVVLKMHYTADDVAGSLEDLLGIAFQDSTGVWLRLKNLTIDKANKIVSVPMMHFSDWTVFDVMSITPSSAAVRVNHALDLNVTYVNAKDDDTSDLAPLLHKLGKITWSATAGTLSAPGDDDKLRIYNAPATIPSINPVAVSAKVQIAFTYRGEKFNNTTLVSNIKIYDGDEVYLLELRVIDNHWVQGMSFIDSVCMRVKVSDTIVTISNIVNFPSKIIPEQLQVGSSTVISIPDPIGELNITKAVGRNAVDFFGPNTGYLGFDFTETNVLTPKYHIITPPNRDEYYGGDHDPNLLGGTEIRTTAGQKYYEQGTPDGSGSDILVKVKLTLQL
jgi:hypothetical protein